MTGIPISNVNNNCSTGSTALYNANILVRAGMYDCTLALGFERMARGSLGTNFPDRESPTAVFGASSIELEETLSAGENHGPGAPRMFANGAQEYFDKFGGSIDHLARIGKSGCMRLDVSCSLQYMRSQLVRTTSIPSTTRTPSSAMDGRSSKSSLHPKSRSS